MCFCVCLCGHVCVCAGELIHVWLTKCLPLTLKHTVVESHILIHTDMFHRREKYTLSVFHSSVEKYCSTVFICGSVQIYLVHEKLFACILTCGSLSGQTSFAKHTIKPIRYSFSCSSVVLHVSSNRSRTPQICTFPTCLFLWMRKSWITCCSPSARSSPHGSSETTAATAEAWASPGRLQKIDKKEHLCRRC